MIVPSSLMAPWLAAWLARTLGVHILGAVGALIIVAGAIVAVADAEAGLAAIAAGIGLLSIGWGLTDHQRPAAAVTTPAQKALAFPHHQASRHGLLGSREGSERHKQRCAPLNLAERPDIDDAVSIHRVRHALDRGAPIHLT